MARQKEGVHMTKKKNHPGMVPGGMIEKTRYYPGKRITTREIVWVGEKK